MKVLDLEAVVPILKLTLHSAGIDSVFEATSKEHFFAYDRAHFGNIRFHSLLIVRFVQKQPATVQKYLKVAVSFLKLHLDRMK